MIAYNPLLPIYMWQILLEIQHSDYGKYIVVCNRAWQTIKRITNEFLGERGLKQGKKQRNNEKINNHTLCPTNLYARI